MTDLERYDAVKRRVEDLRLKWCERANFLEATVKETLYGCSFSEGLLVDEVNAAQAKLIRVLQQELYDALNNENPIT